MDDTAFSGLVSVIGVEPYYQDDRRVVYCGDCREILPKIPAGCMDLVLTDPPYGVNASGGVGGYGVSRTDRHYADTWDKGRPSRDIFALVVSSAKLSIIFGGNYFADLLPQGKHWLVWDKKGDVKFKNPYSDCELLWTNAKRSTVRKYVFRQQGFIRDSKDKRVHPTQKPSELVERLLLDYTGDGELVVDPFLGSGTTCLVAGRLNRYSIGIEIEPKYCEIAANRCADEVVERIKRGEY